MVTKSSESDFQFIVENCKKLGYEIKVITNPTKIERKMIEKSLKLIKKHLKDK